MSDKALFSAEPGAGDTAGSNVIEDNHSGRPDDEALPQVGPGGFDQRAPNAARIYDWLIGGKDHYAADRAAGRRLTTAIPGIRQAAADNRAFLARITRYLAGEAGISQFIDIGSGLPGPGPVHEIAREAQPGVRVVYVDHDPVVVAHARALLSDHPRTGPSQVTAVEADLRYPRNLLTMREIRDTIDLSQPAAVLLIAVLHFIPDDADPHGIVQAITARLAPGSYVAMSHGTADHLDPGAAQAARAAYDGASAPGIPRSRDEIERFLDGLEPVPPGVTDVTAWRPAPGPRRPGLRPPPPAPVLRRRRPHPAPVTRRHRPYLGTDLSMPAPGPAPATIETVIGMLEDLGAMLGSAGWATRLQIAPGRAPSLHVQNPAAAQLAENICAAPRDEGFWFWWSWAEPIAQDPATTTAIIVRALRARPEPAQPLLEPP